MAGVEWRTGLHVVCGSDKTVWSISHKGQEADMDTGVTDEVSKLLPPHDHFDAEYKATHDGRVTVVVWSSYTGRWRAPDTGRSMAPAEAWAKGYRFLLTEHERRPA
jgi:hypothetical protein